LLADLGHLLRVHPALLENQFHITPPASDLAVRMHGTDFIQAVLNLAINGLQSTPQPHHLEITAAMLPTPLDLAAFKETETSRFLNLEGLNNTAPLLKVAVADTGPGIPLAVLPKIFDSYFTTKGPRQGTGLGLNIVLRLVRDASGALWVQTRPGEGTTFTLFLPAVELATS